MLKLRIEPKYCPGLLLHRPRNCGGTCTAIASTVKILKFGTPQTIAIIVLKIEKFDVTLH